MSGRAMWGAIFLSFLVGVAVVLQGALNKEVMAAWGLSSTLLLNAVVFLLVAALYYFLAKSQLLSTLPFLQESQKPSGFSWWYLLPGVFGFLIVFGVPISISELGAFKVFVMVISAQLLGGLLWDLWVEGITINFQRAMAAVLVLAGVVLLNWKA